MKKALVLTLALIMAVSCCFVFSSCGKKDDKLVVATNAYFPPFEYYEGDKLTGIDIQIASLLAEKMGKTLYVLDEEFYSIFSSIKTGEANIGMAGITVNETRQKSYDFSTEYYTSSQVLIVRADDTTFDGKSAEEIEEILAGKAKTYTIGTQKATTGYMYTAGDEGFGYDGFKNLTTKAYSNGALAGKDLAAGTIDAVIIDKQPALMIAKNINKDSTKLKVIDVALTEESYAFCIQKGDAEMKKAADDLLKELKESGRLDEIINSYFDGNATFTYTNPASK